MSEEKFDWNDLELCREWLIKYDSLIQSWLASKESTLTKPYFLKRIWNQLLGIHFREKDNVIDLLKEESIESKIKISNILAEHEKERDLEEQYELTEEELAELERNYTLNDLENKIEELRKKSYPRRLKEWEKENE